MKCCCYFKFREANKVFEEKIRHIETLQIRPTKEPISEEDLNRIVNFDIFSNKQPEFLQLKVNLILYTKFFLLHKQTFVVA